MKKIPKIYFNKDTVFHYTKMETALNHILKDNSLLLKQREFLSDPIEKHPLTPYYLGPLVEDKEKHQALFDYLEKQYYRFYQDLKQISFCSNEQSIIEKTKYFDSLDGLGFSKQRMWDQYAANYTGVCFAFSKKKLRDDVTDLHKLNISSKIKYLYNHQLKELNLSEFDLSQDKELIWSEIQSNLISRIFNKSIDYKDECEFRIVSLTEASEITIPINKAIIGIIYCFNNCSKESKEVLVHYQKVYKMELNGIWFLPDGPTMINPNSHSTQPN